MGKTMNEKEFEKRARQYDNETAEALMSAFNKIKKLAGKYPNFEIHFAKLSAGFRKITTKEGLFIELSKKPKGPGLNFSKKLLKEAGISKEMISRTGKYSEPLEDRKAASKKEQVELFFGCFEGIIGGLGRYN